jgi:hypothetical protein
MTSSLWYARTWEYISTNYAAPKGIENEFTLIAINLESGQYHSVWFATITTSNEFKSDDLQVQSLPSECSLLFLD